MKLHLGCGDHYLKGWVNIDISGSSADVHLDLRKPLPYASETVSFIFCEHFIEHLTSEEAFSLLKECRRVLKEKGVMRIVTPNLEFLVKCYLKNKVREWADVNWEPVSRCCMVNEGMRSWGHQFLYDFDELSNLLRSVGFSSIKTSFWKKSNYPELCNIECRPYHNDLIKEAIK